MTRTDLIDAVYQRHGGISRREAQDLVEMIFARVTATLVAGQRVEIVGFGTFEVVASAVRAGRHPVTGRRFAVAPTRSLQFRPSRRLRAQVNETPDLSGPWRGSAMETQETALSGGASISGEGTA